MVHDFKIIKQTLRKTLKIDLDKITYALGSKKDLKY